MYAQNHEDDIILAYFSGDKGTVLDIGANDGSTFSNSRVLIDKGWQACLVEPSQKAFAKLCQLHNGRERVHCFNTAIGLRDGQCTFFESGAHNGDNVALISTLKESELKRWKGSRFDDFDKTTCPVITFDTFLLQSPLHQFDLISIDAEGMDVAILQQMNLEELACRCLCIEWNGVASVKQAIEHHIAHTKLKLHHSNGENLIYTI